MLAQRNRQLAEFVTAQLPGPPARVLEIGCGAGALARELVLRGYDVTAIDPKAPDGPPFLRLTLAELAPTRPFEAIVAAQTLHHLPDLPSALAKIRELLGPAGALIVDDYAKERVDRSTAEWYYERRLALARSGGRAAPSSFDACLRDWQQDKAEIHTYAAMRAELDLRFRERLFSWEPSLYLELGEAGPKEVEQHLIDTDAIRATGFRYVGETTAP